jgi:hypothetical protein
VDVRVLVPGLLELLVCTDHRVGQQFLQLGRSHALHVASKHAKWVTPVP